jgi:VanZ family protein
VGRFVSVSYVLFVLAIAVAADVGALAPLVEWLHAVPFGDKVCHLSLAAGLGTAAVTIAPTPRIAFAPLSVVMVIALAAIEEFSQRYVPGRHFDLLDLAANTIGLATGALVAVRRQLAWNW